MSKPYFIGIGGGTSSGKTTVAKSISEKLGSNNITYINYDNYYLDLSHLSLSERREVNFDHPNSLDTDLLINDVSLLLDEKPIEMPIYDFVSHTRLREKSIVYPKKIILLEGILALNNFKLRDMMDVKIFVDTATDERLIRRLGRDMKDRGRTFNDIIRQYQETVKPMHEQLLNLLKFMLTLLYHLFITKQL